MDFNTGSSRGNPDDPSRPLFDGEARGSSTVDPAGSGGPGREEFRLSDPVGSFAKAARGVLLNPVGFYRSMQKRGDFVGPLIFALLCAVIYGVLNGIVAFVVNPASGNQDGPGAVVGLVGSIVGAPIAGVIGLFIAAGIFHLLVLLFVRPDNAGFEATFRVVAYAYATLLVSWLAPIPFLGALI